MVRAVLLDLDGVLYVDDESILGAQTAVSGLRAQGLALRFVTNTTAQPRSAILARLQRLGFVVAPDELITPASLAVRHCVDRGHRRVALLMDDAVKADLEVLEDTDDRPQAVIVGDLGDRFSYGTLNRAFRHLMEGAELIALQKNRYWLRPDGLALDVGPFVAALEYAASTEAFVVGKPAPTFFATATIDSIADLPTLLGVPSRERPYPQPHA